MSLDRTPAAQADSGPATDGAAEPAVLDAAIQWRIKLQYNTADAGAWQAFEAWLHARPAHAVVWERLQALGAR